MRCILALFALLVLVGLLALFLHALPFFFPFILGSLALLFFFLLGVFVLGWALLVLFPVVLLGLFAWTLFWILF